jgi:hypothetical protein
MPGPELTSRSSEGEKWGRGVYGIQMSGGKHKLIVAFQGSRLGLDMRA